jgi:hypothetical protein
MRILAAALLLFTGLFTLPAAAQSIIQPGSTIVTVNVGAPTDVFYAAQPGERITVTAVGTGQFATLDPTLEILNAAGVRLAYNDDQGDLDPNLPPFASVIRDLTLESGGAITIRVGTFNLSGAGQVQVTLTSGLQTAPTPIPAQSGASLTAAAQTAGTTTSLTGSAQPSGGDLPALFTGEVPSGGNFTGTLTLTAGEMVTVTVRALDRALDPVVDILDSGGTVLATNDDHGTSDAALGVFDSRISNFIAPSDGVYTIRIDGYGGSAGRFELTITRTMPTGTTQIATGQPIVTTQGDTQIVTVTVPANDVYRYELAVNQGDVYFFTVRALNTDRDPFLVITDPLGFTLALNDDQVGSYPDLSFFDVALGNIIFPQTATYTLQIGEYEDQGGLFELTIRRVATGAPTTPPQQDVVRGSIQPNGSFTHTFEATAGQYITILVNARTAEFDPQVALYSPQGVLLAENDDHSSELNELGFRDSLIRNYPIPETGTYTIEVRGFQDSAGEFNLLIRRPR